MMKHFLPVLLSMVLLLSLCPAFGVSAAEEVSFTLTVDGVDTDVAAQTVVVFPNDTEEARVIPASGFNFRNASLLIFNKEGKLIEAGKDLLANADGTNGSPQTSVTVPAGGFLVGFGASADARLRQCYTTAFEGAMLYNATMSIIYDVNGTFDAKTGKLSVSYAEPEPASKDAVKFLFVGNSATYFNGTPIKLKGLAKAAGLDVSVTYCTFGSAYLREFADANHAYGKALREKLAGGEYDYVVLQDAGGASAEETGAASEVLVPLIRESGAEALFYMRYSASSTEASRKSGSITHYNTYTALAEKYGTKAGPAAVAFYYCMEEAPEIELYADDNSHHSAAGSYLIACTWLRSFLGVSPVGNGYTANLPKDVADTLQAIALKSCDEPFEAAGGKVAVFVDEDGTEYPNAAHRRPYTPVGAPYGGTWTDTAEDGTPIGKFTDGVSVLDGSDALVGCYKGSTVEVIIDLGKTVSLKRVTTDLFGKSDWGIADPSGAKVHFLISEDGETFTAFGEGSSEDGKGENGWTRLLFSYTADDTVDAAFVKVVYEIGGNFCWVSEIQAFAAAEDEEDPSVPGDNSEETSENSENSENSDKSEGSTASEGTDASSETGAGSASADGSSSPETGSKGVLPFVVIALLAVAGGAVAIRAKQ